MIKKHYSDEQILLSITLILCGFGIIVMYSASSMYAMNNFGHHMFFLLQQLKWISIGILLMLITSKINYQLIKKFAYQILLFSWIIMILGYFLKGDNPAARWLIIGGRSWLTTSDLGRLSLIIFTAFFIDKNKKLIHNWKFIITRYFPFLGITLLLILFQPDTSTAITIFIIILTMLFISSMNLNFLLCISSIGIFGLIIKIINTPYAISRIINWNDIQKIQSLNAFGTGGLFGTGLGDSIIKNGYLPQSHTDFILPIIGEELGFIGILLIFLLFYFFYHRGLKIMQKAPDLFSMLLCLGIILSIIIYFLINAAYSIGLAPTTGLPMPFISYGGSHIIITLISIGILINVCNKGNAGINKSCQGASYEF